MKSVAIIGAGLAGLAAAQRCQEKGLDYAVYEKNAYIGGHAYSHCDNGFYFDEGPHISFSKDDQIKDLLAASVEQNYSEQKLKILNYWQGAWYQHPLLCHLYGLPTSLIQQIINDIENNTLSQTDNFKQWCYRYQGKTFSEQFTLPYTKKYWAIDAEQLGTDWLEPRFYIPTLEQIKQGATKQLAPDFHYIKTFRYPSVGGFASYCNAFKLEKPVQCNHAINYIDPHKKTIRFINGEIKNYDYLLSSMPLPKLIDCITQAPEDIKNAAQQLHCTSVKLINIGFKTQRQLPDAHLLYFYDADICFARAHFPHTLAAAMAPANQQSLQLEIYYSPFKPLPETDMIEKALADCYRCQLLSTDDEIVMVNSLDVKYANVLFTQQRQQAVDNLLNYLNSLQIVCCGRYGLWDYYWSDDSIRSGWNAVDKIENRVRNMR